MSAMTWLLCDLCGEAQPVHGTADLHRLRLTGWRQVVVPLLWVQSLHGATVGPDDLRTATIESCPTCSGLLREAFVLVQRESSRHALASIAGSSTHSLALLPAPSSNAPVLEATSGGRGRANPASQSKRSS